MICPYKYIPYMHDYLDGEISTEQEKELKEHLKLCPECQNHFRQLEKTAALLQSTGHIKAPNGFTEKVLARLPKEKRKAGIHRWLRKHPLLTAASLFLMLMMGSVFGTWKMGDDFSVTQRANLIVEDNTVIVPEGEVVKGDIVVRNGDIRIEGKVDGNVTIVNGDKYLASAAEVTGEIEEIDAMFEWIWYHIKKFAAEVGSFFAGSVKEGQPQE